MCEWVRARDESKSQTRHTISFTITHLKCAYDEMDEESRWKAKSLLLVAFFMYDEKILLFFLPFHVFFYWNEKWKARKVFLLLAFLLSLLMLSESQEQLNNSWKYFTSLWDFCMFILEWKWDEIVMGFVMRISGN